MLLSPIQELEGNNGTITSVASNSSGFSSLALAKTVLPPALLSSGMPKQALPLAVNVPLTAVSMSQSFFTSLGIGDKSDSAPNSAVLTDVTASDKDDSACGGSSSGSISGGEERMRKTSVTSQSRSKKEVYV